TTPGNGNGNGNGNGSGSGAALLAWEPETPFLVDPAPAPAPPRPSFQSLAPAETPFATEYHGDDARPVPHAEEFAALMDELHDDELDEAVEDLVNEAVAVVDEGFGHEVGEPQRDRAAMERVVREYLEPLERETDAVLARMAEGLAAADVQALGDDEVDALLESYATVTHELPPAFEGFIGGLVRKAKKAVKGALRVAKKVASVVAAPHLLVLNRLRGLVRPMLLRVLRMAIDRLPAAVRPAATILAQRFLGLRASSAAPSQAPAATTAPADEPANDAADAPADAATVDSEAVQEELDTRLAGSLLAGERFEQLEEMEARSAAQRDLPADALQQLEQARRAFAERVVGLRPGESAAPAVEEFVPAILPALRLGVRIVGRPRVVRFLAGLVAKLIARYVGQAQAPALSAALVDAGLKLVSLETPDDREAAGQTIAATVEDTVARLVREAPAAAWESEALLEAYAHEVFQESAAAHFPDALIRGELHETSAASGAWLPFPATSPRKSCKKYSRVIDVSITPQMADAVRSFGGRPLRAFLADRMGLPLREPVKARVHLYEAIPGTRLSLVALHERGVPGLGSHRRAAWSLFHPLTPEAAGVLLQEPGLGRAIPPAFLARRRTPALGQRFYYLEIPGARVRLARRRGAQSTRPARSSRPRVKLDFVRRQLRVALYFGEAHAQRIAAMLRQGAPLPAVLAALHLGQARQLGGALGELSDGGVGLVHEAAPTRDLAAPLLRGIARAAGPRLAELAREWLLQVLTRELEARREAFAARVEKAAQADEDGLTIRVAFDAAPLVAQLRGMLAGGAAAAPRLAQALGAHELQIVPGLAAA
ncbi:MAG TPA: hypothetical protein VEA99_14915, partial [Gemmatimonadaceae bacterium]|nr:hypothetical protein [Gemmatimonadaceae bacterium]